MTVSETNGRIAAIEQPEARSWIDYEWEPIKEGRRP